MLQGSAATPFQLSPIKAIELAASKIPGVISLAQGIPSFETPTVIREFIREKIALGLCDKYSLTTGLPELREEIALSLSADGTPYDPDSEIIVTAGSIEGISAALLASTEPGDEVLLPSPSYTSHQGAVRVARCTPRFVELDEDNNFDFQVDRIAAAITRRTKVILFSSPNNPTGTLFSEEKTRALVSLAARHGITLVIDEVYKDFYYTDSPHFSAIQIPEARNSVIRVCSFSKAFAMTGWRVGFVHGPTDRIRSILRYHDALVTCAPVASQYGAIAALRYGSADLARFRAEFKERRDYTVRALDQLSDVLDYQVPNAAYFVFPRIKDTVPNAHDSTTLAYDILEKAKVAVVPGIAFGPSGESHLRITFGRSREDLQEGLRRFAEYFQKLSTAQALPAQRQDITPRESQNSVQRVLATSFLRVAARTYLARTRPTIIGIAGSRGKTTVKRLITELFGSSHGARGNILSYNTELGLPLSILKLKAPRSLFEKLSLPFKALGRIVAPPDHDEILVLEYGLSSPGDATQLLQIATPDWLVVVDGSPGDPSQGAEQFRSELRAFIAAVPKDRVVWAGEDEWLATAGELRQELAVTSSWGGSNKLEVLGREWKVTREVLGQSAQFGIAAAVFLASRFQVDSSQIERFLAPPSL